MDESANDLTILVERLRSSGFRVDTRQYLTAHELLLAFARLGRPLDDATALASHLGPIFCTLPEEQRRFASVIESWRGTDTASPAGEPAPVAPKPFYVWRRWRMRAIGIVLASALALGVLFIVYLEFAPIGLDGVVVVQATDGTTPAPEATVRFRGKPVGVDSQGRFRVTTTRAAGEGLLQAELPGYAPASASVDIDTEQPIVLKLQLAPVSPPPPPDAPFVVDKAQIVALGTPLRTVNAGGPRWNVILTGAALAGVAALLALWLAGREKRRLALKRLEALGDAEECTLRPADASAIVLADHEMRRLASALRRPREQPVVELDPAASVEATLRAGGLFVPVYAPRRATPEYLVLVDRHGIDDHWADWVDQWIERLSDSGVAIERYTFRDDPRMCFGDDDKRRAHRLTELVAHHHRATLMMFCESGVFFDGLRDALEPWVGALHPLPRRVVFTPEMPFRWGNREWQLAADGFVVLPAGVEGLRTYAEIAGDWRIERLFPAPYARAYPRAVADEPRRYLDRNAPPDAIADTLIRQVRGSLGPDGFAWLCACAVYPQISWPLTLALAPAVGVPPGRDGARAQSMDLLPALARLPWLRRGFMPDWLRQVLIAQLSPAQRASVRATLESLLEQLVLAASPEAVKAGVVQAARPSRGPPIAISRWIGPIDLLRAAPPASPLRDRIFLGFIAGVSRDTLTLEVRDAFRRLFRRDAGALPEATRAPTGTSAGAAMPDDVSLPARATHAADRARRVARALIERVGGLMALHPTAANALMSAGVGVAAFAVLAAVLPAARVPAPSTSSFVAFSPDGKSLVASAADGGLAWVRTADRASSLRPRVGAVATAAVFSRDGATLAVGYDDGGVDLIDVTNRRALGVRAKAASTRILSMSYDADGRLWTASADALAQIDPKRSQVLTVLPLPVSANVVKAITLDHAARRYALLDTNGTLRLSGIGGAEQASTFDELSCNTIAAPAFSPDDRYLACGGPNGAVIWDIATGTLSNAPIAWTRDISLARSGDITSIAISADGYFVAVGTSDGTIEFVDLLTRQQSRGPPDVIEGGARAAAFSPTGDLFVAATTSEVDLWPMAARRPAPTAGDPNAQQASTTTLGTVEQQSQAPARRVTLPSLVGRPVRTALIQLERQKLQLAQPQTRASSAPKDTIIAQNPAGGSLVLPGSSVSVVVSDGSLARVPNVVGAPIDGAQKMLAQVGLSVASVQSADSNEPAGTVISQQPRAGVEVSPRSSVTLYVAKAAGTAPVTQTAPNAPADVVQRNVPDQAQIVQSQGWCCIRRGVTAQQNALPELAAQPVRSTADECRKRGGEFSTDEKEARARCLGSPQPPVLMK